MVDIARIRKTYVMARVVEMRGVMSGVGNWRQARKNVAHEEFNDMLRSVREDERAKVLAEIEED